MRRGYKNLFFLILIASVAIAWGGCQTEGTEKTSNSISSLGGGRLQASPEPLVFKQVGKIGESDVEPIVLKNISSDGDLHITGLQIIESTDSGRDDFREFSPGTTWFSFNSGPKRLPPNTSEKIEVKYTARDKYAAKGVLRVFVSGDPNLPEGYLEIPLQSLPREPDIDTINPVTFPRVNLDQWACRDILLTNVGPEPLKIKNWVLRDSNKNFRVKLFREKPSDGLCDDPTPKKMPSSAQGSELPQKDVDRYNNVLKSLNSSTSANNQLNIPSLGHKNSQGVEDNHAWIRYYVQPVVGNKQEAQLDLNTNRSRGNEIYTVSLEVNTSPDCLTLDGERFATREIKTPSHIETTYLRNSCLDANQAPIAVHNVEIKPGSTYFIAEKEKDSGFCVNTEFNDPDTRKVLPKTGSEFFKIVPHGEGTSQTAQWPYSLSVGEKKPLDIETTAIGDKTCTGTYYATLLVSTNDPTTPQKEFPIKATVVDILRPEAIARARVIGDSASTQSLAVQGTTNRIQLESISKFYKTTNDKKYKWEATSAPESQLKSCKRWADSQTGNIAQYGVSSTHSKDKECFATVGDYTFKLTVSQDGVDSKPTQQSYVYVTVQPDTEYYIELTWSSSPSLNSEPDADADGADLDLHVIKAVTATDLDSCSYELWNGENAVYHTHRSIGLCNHGNKAKCTKLVYDDVNGLGPEAVSISNPGNSERYLVGVNYFNTNGWGVVYAVVKIWRILTKGEEKTPPELVFATLGLPPRGYLTGTDLNFWDVAEIIPGNCNNKIDSFCRSIFTHNRFYTNMAYANKETRKCLIRLKNN